MERFPPGDRVMVPFNVFCGSCYFCARGLYFNCHNVNPNATAGGGIYGYSHTCGGYDGGQSEYVRVPFADVGPQFDPTLSGAHWDFRERQPEAWPRERSIEYKFLTPVLARRACGP